MKRLAAILRTPRLLSGLIRSLKRQRDFLQVHILPHVQEALAGNDHSLDEQDLKKIKNYYGLAVPAILGEAICALHGTSMTAAERMASTCQGAMSGLFDDFFDKKDMSEAQLQSLLQMPGENQGSSNEKLFLHFYTTALSNCPDPVSMQQRLWQVYAAQLESKKQAGGLLTEQETEDITIRKGGYSLLFYRTAFDHKCSESEEALLYHFGALIQVSNDIFDVYKDLQQNINTLVTSTSHISLVRDLFLNMLEEGKVLARQTEFPKPAIQQFLDIFYIAVFSRCLVCLDQFESKEKRSGGKFLPLTYSRKDLICDMELPINKWRSLRYYMRYASL